MARHLVIVGGGQAAAQAILTLRQQGYGDAITLVGAEPYAPYQRPPLSKKYFAGEVQRERLLLRPTSFYSEKGVTLELGRTAVGLRLDAHGVQLDDGRELSYDRLLLATGSRVRKLGVPGVELAGVHYVRTIQDIDSINAELQPGARVAVIGGGYIGLEVAAVATQRGFAVTVLETVERVLARVVSPEVSAFYEQLHRSAGVEVHCGAAVRALHGNERVASIETADGRRFACDVAIVGIGIVPNVELAERAGLPCANGILVDEHARTADPDVLAAGDCTSHPLSLYGRRVRLESVQNAVHQGKVAAAALLGTPAAYSELPWFWSDQYDVKLQIAGLSQGYDEVALRGDPATRSFVAYYLARGRLIAVDAINSPREFALGKKLVSAGFRIGADALRDPRTDVFALG
jgi:3-phenylpropionate/trans-cinnamate dioxygenase ferredoxin reductase subunit